MKNPDDVSFILLFNACAQLQTKKALDLVKQVSSDMPNSFHSNPRLVTSFLDALIKCGDVEGAEALFHQTKSKHSSLYGAMMKGRSDID